MGDALPVPELLRKNAESIASRLSDELGVKLTFDEAGVEWVDGYIERMRPAFHSNYQGLAAGLAVFIGECLLRTYGGEWMNREGEWGIQITPRLWAAPLSKVEKQFQNGPEDSVASFFRSISGIIEQLQKEESQGDKV